MWQKYLIITFIANALQCFTLKPMAYYLAILVALIVCSLWTSWYKFNYSETLDNKSLTDNFYILNEHFVVLPHDTHVTYIFFP